MSLLQMIKWDWTVNLGNLIPTLTFLGIIIWRISNISTKVDILWLYFTSSLERRGDQKSRNQKQNQAYEGRG